MIRKNIWTSKTAKGWEVKSEDSTQSPSTFKTQSDAISKGKKWQFPINQNW